jgi:ATP-binding cassette subfamily D (ALD) long-chain fatty acid import protein
MSTYTTHLRSLSPSHRRSLVVLLASVVILRSRIFTAPKDIWAKLNVVARGSKLTAEDLNNVLQQLYITEADGSRTLLVPYRNEYLSKVSVSRAEVMFLGDRSRHLHSNALCLALLHWT